MKRTLLSLALLGTLSSLPMLSMAADASATGPIRNVVLVHGFYADGSGWNKVIERLQKAGLHVTAVQNPLISWEEELAATRRALDMQDGPTVLVGHSWAGTVISETGNDPKVKSLVYVAARAPDAGEDFAALAKQYPATPVSTGLVKFNGFTQLSEQAFVHDFAGDLPESEARAMYASQGRVADSLYTARTTQAAWHDKPSWYAVSSEDRTTSPDLERFLAKRMNAHTVELKSSHVSMLSHPDEIANLILTAAGQKHP